MNGDSSEMNGDSSEEVVRFLDDVRVIEVASLAPTQLGMHLADLGAEVIKIESPRNGDPTRLIGLRESYTDSALHRRWNRGKRSIALDLAAPAGKDVFRRLVKDADIVIDGMRAGTLGRLGIGWSALTTIKTNLVFVALSGYGQTGPYMRMASHGLAYDAIAGLAPAVQDDLGRTSIPHHHSNRGTVLAPLFASTASLAALSWSRRTGRPVFLDVAQADASVFANMHLEDYASDRHRIAAGLPPALPSEDTNPHDLFHDAVTVQYYRTRDNKVVLLMALERKFFVRFAQVVGRPDLLVQFPEDQYESLLRGNDALRQSMIEIFGQRDLDEWMRIFAEADIPGVPENENAQVLDDPQVGARATWLQADDATVTMKTPIRSTPDLASPSPAPAIGQHSAEILSMVGLNETEIDGMARAGAVRLGIGDTKI